MKKSFVALAVLVCAAAGAGTIKAAGEDSATACNRVSDEVARHSTAFSRLVAASPEPALSPEKALRKLQHRDTALENATNQIWSLRAKMTNLACPQAQSLVF